MTTIDLPTADGRIVPFEMGAPRGRTERPKRPFNRIAFAAAHVVADPLADSDPWIDSAIDWEATLAFRRHLWGLGLGVAEAMDTAQRGMGLDWETSHELIRRSVAEARATPGAVLASGAGTDHVVPDPDLAIEDVVSAYEEQCGEIEAGGRADHPDGLARARRFRQGSGGLCPGL